MADIQQAFMSLPPVTRTLLAGTGLTTLPTALAILSPYLIVFDTVGLRKLQLWRLVTPFFYAGGLTLVGVLPFQLLIWYTNRLWTVGVVQYILSVQMLK